MPRRIPNRAMPHEATISRYTGTGARGHTWGDPEPPVRANFNPRSKTRAGGGTVLEIADMDLTVTSSSSVLLDATTGVHVLDRVKNSVTGDELVIASISTWDVPPVQPFLECTLGIL